jgi:uncharacterized membrane protein (DUF485 family)
MRKIFTSKCVILGFTLYHIFCMVTLFSSKFLNASLNKGVRDMMVKADNNQHQNTFLSISRNKHGL